MAEIDKTDYLFHHLMDSSHIPFDFDSDSWNDLAMEAAHRNDRVQWLQFSIQIFRGDEYYRTYTKPSSMRQKDTIKKLL